MADHEDAAPSDDPRYLQTVQYRDSSNLARRRSLHDRFSVNQYGFHRWVFDHFTVCPDACVLEVGCGSGQLWERNIDRVPAGWTVTLSDFSAGMLRDARRTLGSHAPRFRYTVAEAQSIPCCDHAFDAVIANHMLYHVPDRPAALAEIRRVLRPDGRLYASANGLHHLRELGDLVRAYAPECWRDTRGAWAFGLENGREQLLEHFADVSLFRYEDALVVTDPSALLQWAESWAQGTFAPDRLAGLYAHLSSNAVPEQLRVTKDSGLFVAEVGLARD